MTMRVYRTCGAETSLCMLVEMSRGDGRGWPVTEVARGLERPARGLITVTVVAVVVVTVAVIMIMIIALDFKALTILI